MKKLVTLTVAAGLALAGCSSSGEKTASKGESCACGTAAKASASTAACACADVNEKKAGWCGHCGSGYAEGKATKCEHCAKANKLCGDAACAKGEPCTSCKKG